MKTRLPHFLMLACAAALPALAELAEAEKLLRAGKPAEALAELQLEPHSPAALYWKGRALLELRRLPQAAGTFREVPADSVFYPYAAKGIIYCAWQSPVLDFVEHVAPLTASTNSEIATLAQAALAEHQLRNTVQGDTSTLEPLRKLAEKDAGLRPMVQLLNIEEMRRSGKYEQAIEACRRMEADTAIPLIMRQRVRLALAEVYYDKAAAAAKNPAPVSANEEEEDDEGKGEETLLHFIAANAESPLLEEAFRRLDARNAFSESEYARRRLEEWSQELTKPHRAALALAIRQRMQLTEDEYYNVGDVTYANTAATALPNEPVSRLIISEQVRRLINKGNTTEAALYLNMLKQDYDDPRFLFYKACCMPSDNTEAVELFRKSAEVASADLQAAALCNAMFCAVQAGEQDAVDKMLIKELPTRVRRRLLLMHAGLILHNNPAQARAEIESVMLLEPTPEELAEIHLQLAELSLGTSPEAAMQELEEIPAGLRKLWNHEQTLRFYSLKIQATEILLTQGADIPEPTELLRDAINATKKKETRMVLAFNLAYRLSQQERNREALQLLLGLAEQADNSEQKARALLLAGRQAERLNSYDRLKEAAEHFKAAAELNSPYSNKARILRARVLAWTNHLPEAMSILSELLRSNTMSAVDRALALSVQAHVHTLRGTDEALEEAIKTNAEIFTIENLPSPWLVRAKIQQASLHARCGQIEQALRYNKDLIEGCKKDENAMDKADWFVLYFAGAGAISQCVDCGRYEEAADLADRIACWPHTCEKGARTLGKGPRAAQFAQWADNIRKVHFLPGVQTPKH